MNTTLRYCQAAIQSGAKKLVVPNMDKAWIVKPLFLESDYS